MTAVPVKVQVGNILQTFAFISLIAVHFSLLTSCSNLSTPTQGSTRISVDESFRPLLEAEVAAFEGFYKQADIETEYLPEADLLEALMKDSTRIAVMGRDLTEKEIEYFNNKKSFPRSTRIGMDALAFITHPDNSVKELLYSEVKRIFSGEINSWKALDPSLKGSMNADTAIQIVFDNERSLNARMLREQLLDDQPFPANTFAMNSNPDVLDHVSKNKRAIGIIGVNWISDVDDSITRGFLDKVNVLGISSEDNPGEYFKPFQAYIYSKEYPFCRDMYVINREGRTGLGTGFAAFLAGTKGQLIILKAGMVPATQPVRKVTIKNS